MNSIETTNLNKSFSNFWLPRWIKLIESTQFSSPWLEKLILLLLKSLPSRYNHSTSLHLLLPDSLIRVQNLVIFHHPHPLLPISLIKSLSLEISLLPLHKLDRDHYLIIDLNILYSWWTQSKDLSLKRNLEDLEVMDLKDLREILRKNATKERKEKVKKNIRKLKMLILIKRERIQKKDTMDHQDTASSVNASLD